MKFNLEQQQIMNKELQSKLSAANQGHINDMDIEQVPIASLTSYNAEICESVKKSLELMVTRIEHSMNAQYQNLISSLSEGDHQSKRKPPADTNGLNNTTPSLSSQPFSQSIPTQNIATDNNQSSNELQPPVEKIKPKVSRSIYQIYVSKFKNDTTPDKIIKHVITKSLVKDQDLFSVEMLVKPKEKVQKLSYVSFKITTCSENVYDAIMNEEIWAPNFTAAPFMDQKHSNSSGIKSKHSQPLTPVQVTMHRRNGRNDRHESGNKSQKRVPKVKFDENNLADKTTNQNATPRSSFGVRKNSLNTGSSSHLPTQNQFNENNASAVQMPHQMPHQIMQQPAFFGIPGLVNNQMQPIYYQIRPSFSNQQPQTSQQPNQASLQQQQIHHPQQQLY